RRCAARRIARGSGGRAAGYRGGWRIDLYLRRRRTGADVRNAPGVASSQTGGTTAPGTCNPIMANTVAASGSSACQTSGTRLLRRLSLRDCPRGIYQTDVAESLWEVAQHFAASRVHLFSKQTNVVRVGDGAFEGAVGSVELTGKRLRLG